MYNDTEQWREIRNQLLQGVSKRQVQRETGMHWTTINKILDNPYPPEFNYPESKRRCSLTHRRDQAWDDLLNIIANSRVSQARSVIASLAHIGPNALSRERLTELRDKLAESDTLKARQFYFDEELEAHVWMREVTQGAIPRSEIRTQLGDIDDLDTLVDRAQNGRLTQRNRAITVLAKLRDIPSRHIGSFICKSRAMLNRHWNRYRVRGVDGLFKNHLNRERKAENKEVKSAVFSLLHSPPKEHGINRTTWKMDDLKQRLHENGYPLCKDVIREVIKSAGYRWRKAKVVLTSSDPEYREKLERIHSILSTLGRDERFFSIDEFGPFAVKMKGGRKLVAPGEYPTVPQFQKSKGCLIVTAALELSRNQITHFYSEKKNTAEMLKLLDVLLEEYSGLSKLYLSWDAASWHISKKLLQTVEEINAQVDTGKRGAPIVELAVWSIYSA
jgi:transposase